MDRKKVIIIGGGISGMTTGIYLQINGYDTEIVEKNANYGGACTGWERKGCYIDGCIHWMTGVNPGSSYYDLWRDTHAITDDTEIYFQEDFAFFDFGGGRSFTVWADADKLEKELVAFAPEDEKEIRRFCKLVRRFQRIEGPVNKPVDQMGLGQLLKVAFTMGGDLYWVSKMSKISCSDYAKKFKNKDLRSFFEGYMAPGYNLMSMLYMLAHVTAHNGGIPIGGSKPLTDRMAARYTSLGGKFRLASEVEKVRIEDNRAIGVELKSGEFLPADRIVSSTAAEHCLKKLLGGRYAVKKIDERLADMKNYPIYTYSTVVFKCTADVSDKPLGAHLHLDDPIVFDRAYNGVTFRNYSYDKTMKRPDGSVVIQAGILGGDGMYYWWKDRQNDGTYRAEKEAFGQKMLELAGRKYPEFADKLEVIDVITPCTYERYLNSRHGSFQGFVHTSEGKTLSEKGVIKGLDNFLLSGQCIFHSGGMPPAAITGRFAAQRICKKDGVKFRYDENGRTK